MPVPSDPRRKRKIRCPKCTALLSEPPFAVFECPICSTLLLAKGAVSSEVTENGNSAESIQDGSLKQVKQSDFEQRKQDQVSENDKSYDETQSIDGSKKEVISSDCKELILNTTPTEVKENVIVSDNKSTLLNDLEAEISSGERIPTLNNVIAKAEESASKNDQEAMPLVVEKNEEKRILLENEKDENHALVDEHGNGANLKARNFRDAGHELSFKYSLEGKDQDHFFQRNLKSEYVKDDVLSSPLNAPLQVSLAWCSDPTEDESCYSSTFDSESHNDGSEPSEFDFPAPSREHMQALNLPTPFIKKRESSYTTSGPHVLEFRDPHDDISCANDGGSLHANSMKETVNQELVREVENGGTDSCENQQDNLQGVISGFRRLEIGKDLSESNSGANTTDSTISGFRRLEIGKELSESNSGANTTDSTMMTSDDKAHDVGGCSERICSGQQRVGDCSNGKGKKQSFFHNNGVNNLQSKPPQELRNLPEKLQLFDSEGRLIYQADKQNNKNMNQLDRNQNKPIVDGDRYLQHVSASDDWDLYCNTSPNHSIEVDLYEPSPIGFPCNPPFSNQMNLTVSSPQRYGYANNDHLLETYSIGESSENRAYPYQVSSKLAMRTRPMSECAYTHHGYHHHHVFRSYMHNQPAHIVPTQMPRRRLGHSQPISSMMHQTGSDEWSNCYNQGHAQSSCPSKAPRSYDPLNLKELNSPASSLGRMYKHYPLLPTGGAAPYIICKACSLILEVPPHLPLKGVRTQKIRCGGCDKVSRFSTDYENKRPLLYGVVMNAQPLVHSAQQRRLLTVSSGACHMASFDEKFISTSRDQDVCKRSSAAVSDVSTVQDLQEGKTSALDTTHSKADTSVSYGMKACCEAVLAVDEKEEGLDFGAPRISDGDSLESRSRSPENQGNNNLGDIELKNNELSSSEAAAAAAAASASASENLEIQDNAELVMAQKRKKEGLPLLVLLNQGSKKFSINLESIPYEEEIQASSLAAAATTIYNRSPHWRHRDHSHSLSRGPKYIAGFFRRSLRDISKGQ